MLDARFRFFGLSPMRRLSSKQTFWFKRVFPVIWFSGLAVVLVISLVSAIRVSSFAAIPFVAIPVVLMLGGYFLLRQLVLDLVDEVFDAGDGLVVRNKGQSARIALRDIVNVDSLVASPPRIVLTLRTPTPFGQKVAFSPIRPFTLNPFAGIPIANELIERIDQARRKSPL